MPKSTYMVDTLIPEAYDAISDCEYDASGNMLSCNFRKGGVTGNVLSTLTMTYDVSGNLLTAERS